MSWVIRGPLVLIGVILIALLVTARQLEPSASGYGTHRRLGLPPCSFRLLFNRPCPSCGMTTSWAYFTRGRIADAISAHPAGALLAMMAAISAPWVLLSGARGRWFVGCPNEFVWIGLVLAVFAVTLLTWILRLL